jgi:hypothetical protein
MSAVFAWIISHGWRQLLGAAVMLALFISVLAWNAHERNLGEARCETKHEAVNVQAQVTADKAGADANAEVHAKFDPLTQSILEYGAAYADKSKPADCTPAAYTRKIKP